jgi:hypothetical protein
MQSAMCHKQNMYVLSNTAKRSAYGDFYLRQGSQTDCVN